MIEISIHALLAESDHGLYSLVAITPSFLSTLSLRRATIHHLIPRIGTLHFYPRSPCGERRVHYDNYNLHCVISIHALLAESDLGNVAVGLRTWNFYPRSPCGERRSNESSEHTNNGNFYPRSPCGERRPKARKKSREPNFYPRSPCGERPLFWLI